MTRLEALEALVGPAYAALGLMERISQDGPPAMRRTPWGGSLLKARADLLDALTNALGAQAPAACPRCLGSILDAVTCRCAQVQGVVQKLEASGETDIARTLKRALEGDHAC